MSALIRFRQLEDRLSFLRKLLTQERVDEKIDHYHRELLNEEALELEIKIRNPLGTDQFLPSEYESYPF